jgi:polar amino acid transport system substrate-binding protein
MCEFDGLVAALQSDKADVISGCMSITPERVTNVDFSSPHYRAALVLLIRNEEYVHVETNFWENLKTSFERTFIVENRWKLILNGLGVTILISFCAGFCGLLLGFLLCMLKREGSHSIRKITNIFIHLVQGTPIVVFLMILYFIIFGSVSISPLPIAILGFTINFGVYAAEIYQNGLNTVDNGQREAALALGYTPKQTFWKVIFPQAAQHFLPILKAQYVSMVKETSIVGYISVQDLTMVTDIIHARTMEAFFPLIVTAAIYFIIADLLTSFLRIIEIKIDPKRGKRTVKGVKMQ